MRIRFACLLAITFVIRPPLVAQNAAIVGGGYRMPVPLSAAPGQIMTIFASGVGAHVTQRVAANAEPLPTTLAGITVSFSQALAPTGPVAAPLLSVSPLSTCGISKNVPCSSFLAVTLQIPFELGPNVPGTFRIGNSAQLIVSDGTATSGAVQLYPVVDQIHVMQYGDTILPVMSAEQYGPVVTHADGSLVLSTNPARIGEELIMYASGLGATSPAAPTGAPSPSPAAKTVSQFALVYDYRSNATPSNILISSQTATSPLFSGLVPGLTGIYQVNFVVPPPPGTVPNCGEQVIGEQVTSNLTVNLIGASSFDGAPICVSASAVTATGHSGRR